MGGNDLIFVDNALDKVIEAVGGGIDQVLASVNYVLTAGAEVELLTTTNTAGSTTLRLTGNEFGQTIYGDGGANRLDGKGGADTMNGFGGNDLYWVDNALDKVIEAVGGGTADQVLASTNHTLTAGSQIEIFTTTDTAGSTAINLAGNEFGQTVYGNAGANVLDGKGGTDTLKGWGGHDSFAFSTALGAGNIDTIDDFSVLDDTIRLAHTIFTGLGAAHVLDAAAFVIGAAATNASQHIIYNSATGNLFFDDDGLGGHAQQQFAHLDTGLAMTNNDFFVM
jgi:Ca2+-binding RTX toxin-like protein